jgi:hypothetical protein
MNPFTKVRVTLNINPTVFRAIDQETLELNCYFCTGLNTSYGHLETCDLGGDPPEGGSPPGGYSYYGVYPFADCVYPDIDPLEISGPHVFDWDLLTSVSNPCFYYGTALGNNIVIDVDAEKSTLIYEQANSICIYDHNTATWSEEPNDGNILGHVVYCLDRVDVVAQTYRIEISGHISPCTHITSGGSYSANSYYGGAIRVSVFPEPLGSITDAVDYFLVTVADADITITCSENTWSGSFSTGVISGTIVPI